MIFIPIFGNIKLIFRIHIILKHRFFFFFLEEKMNLIDELSLENNKTGFNFSGWQPD